MCRIKTIVCISINNTNEVSVIIKCCAAPSLSDTGKLPSYTVNTVEELREVNPELGMVTVKWYAEEGWWNSLLRPSCHPGSPRS